MSLDVFSVSFFNRSDVFLPVFDGLLIIILLLLNFPPNLHLLLHQFPQILVKRFFSLYLLSQLRRPQLFLLKNLISLACRPRAWALRLPSFFQHRLRRLQRSLFFRVIRGLRGLPLPLLFHLFAGYLRPWPASVLLYFFRLTAFRAFRRHLFLVLFAVFFFNYLRKYLVIKHFFHLFFFTDVYTNFWLIVFIMMSIVFLRFHHFSGWK